MIVDRVGELFVTEIVEAGCGRQIRSLSHGVLHRLGLGPLRCSQHLGGPAILCYL
jgi:hypothetical protein